MRAPTIPPVAAPAAAPTAVAASQPAATTGPSPRNRKQTQPGHKTCCTTNTCAYPGTGSRAFRAIIDTIVVAIDFLAGKPAVRIIGDDADVGMRHARRFKALNTFLGAGVVIVET